MKKKRYSSDFAPLGGWFFNLFRDPGGIGPWFVQPMLNLSVKGFRHGPFEKFDEAQRFCQKLKTVRSR